MCEGVRRIADMDWKQKRDCLRITTRLRSDYYGTREEMKDCTHCRHADWAKTKAGKLHPSGHGSCRYEVKIPLLPASKRWGIYGEAKPSGGFISRKTELPTHCVYYEKKS